MTKSFVGMGHSVCPYCGKKHNEVVLLDKRMKDTLTNSEFMGFELCPEHKELSITYLLAMGAIEGEDGKPQPTGVNVAIKREVANEIFTLDTSNNEAIYLDQEVVDDLILKLGMQNENSGQGEESSS